MSKKERNQKNYERNKEARKEKARQRYVEAKKNKTFAELMKEFANQVQLSESRFMEQVIAQTGLKPIEVVTVYKKLREDLNLTENQRLHIHNNIPAKKALNERLTREHKIGDLL